VPVTVTWEKTGPRPEGYYANTCRACGKVQGDNYLYRVDGPFYERR
jgi:hypothetical protein